MSFASPSNTSSGDLSDRDDHGSNFSKKTKISTSTACYLDLNLKADQEACEVHACSESGVQSLKTLHAFTVLSACMHPSYSFHKLPIKQNVKQNPACMQG